MADAWSQDTTLQLQVLVAAKFTGSEIALVLGMTRSAVMGKLHRLNIRLERKPPSSDPAVIRRKERVQNWRKRNPDRWRKNAAASYRRCYAAELARIILGGTSA
jgi:hypothetical protein